MRKFIYCVVGVLLVGIPSLAHQRAMKGTMVTNFSAKPGFYIRLDVCHACAYYGWQRDTISAFRKVGIQAFVAEDTASHYTEQQYWTLPSLLLRKVSQKKDEDWSVPVYAGPFDFEQAAKQEFSKLASILKPSLDEFDKHEVGNKPLSRQFTDCTGNQCTLAGYFVQFIKVQS
ncbi:MAG TPA: hypothetical protein VH988_04625 [Thermoanaerobaculia bacterium]|jgi:hypothetical protein|nr:hypothetical protein [Thermoanaerobaculia bacterium]